MSYRPWVKVNAAGNWRPGEAVFWNGLTWTVEQVRAAARRIRLRRYLGTGHPITSIISDAELLSRR